MPVRPNRYTAVAITLHWLIAAAILTMIPMGWWMGDAINDPAQQALAYRVFQIHKSVGFLILALTVLRVLWRLAHPVPALPQAMKGWEQFAARATHVAFYGLMIALPLTGWVYVSAGWAVETDTPLAVATSWFGLFGIPHIGFVEHAAEAVRRNIAFASMGAHSKLAWGVIVLVVLHVGAALKHQFLNRDGVLAHMVPVFKHVDGPTAPEPKSSIKWAERLVGLGFVVILATATAIAARPAPMLEETTREPVTAVATKDADVVAGTAQAWTIDKAQSSITFSGTHSGAPFTGTFGEWDAKVWFDPADLAGSKAVVTISTASGKTGDATKDGSLGGAEWFDPTTYPTARFEADSFTALGGNRFEARGTLRIKTMTVPVVLPFTFDEASGVATVKGKVELDRTAFDLGMASDAAGSWVSKAIEVSIKVRAERAS